MAGLGGGLILQMIILSICLKYAVLNKDDDIRKYFIVKEDSEDLRKSRN